MELVLHQFSSSHFNEKARWALDWKRLAHRRVSYLPGPHVLLVRRLSGQTAVPILDIGDERIVGSARILDALEQRYPEPPLYPADADERRRALQIQQQFDTEIGPAVRTAIFSVMIDEPAFVAGLFARTKPAPVRALYRAMLPMAKRMMAADFRLGEREHVSRCFETARRALDLVAKETEATGQLVGDRFCVADLAAAALLAPLVGPPHPDMSWPEPLPEAVAAFRARWSEHPGAHWVLTQYEKHRPIPGAR